jgi:hypothetical protein
LVLTALCAALPLLSYRLHLVGHLRALIPPLYDAMLLRMLLRNHGSSAAVLRRVARKSVFENGAKKRSDSLLHVHVCAACSDSIFTC